jgi:hypothetical protein
MRSQAPLGHALKTALEYRVRNGIPLDAPCDVYELIVRQAIELRFMEVKSLEGLYLVDGTAAQINVCAYRPAGLQRFTAAHELGHHVFGHGSSFDPDLDYKERFSSFGPQERLADMFSRFLLMPLRAVHAGFSHLGATTSNPSPAEVFKVASWLGVGYTSLLHQMRWSLRILAQAEFDLLIKEKPQNIKQGLTPSISKCGRTELWPVHSSWAGTHIHAEIGDVITGLDQNTSEIVTALDPATFQATAVGQSKLPLLGGGEVKISVCRKEFVGFYDYRYLPEPKDA